MLYDMVDLDVISGCFSTGGLKSEHACLGMADRYEFKLTKK